MNNRRLTFLMAGCMMLAAPGCSKLRQMTRRDYGLLKDPFASSLADNQVPGDEDQRETANQAGFVQLGDPSDAGAAGSQAIATYPGSQPGEGGRTAAQNPAFRGVTIQNAAGRRGGPSLQDLDEPEQNTVASAAAFSQQSSAQDSVAVDEEMEELVNDFARFASQREQQWRQEVKQVQADGRQAVNETKAALKTAQSDIERVAAEVAETPGDVLDHLTSPFEPEPETHSAGDSDSMAQPLIQDRRSTRTQRPPAPEGLSPHSTIPLPRQPLSRLAGPRRTPPPTAQRTQPRRTVTPPTGDNFASATAAATPLLSPSGMKPSQPNAEPRSTATTVPPPVFDSEPKSPSPFAADDFSTPAKPTAETVKEENPFAIFAAGQKSEVPSQKPAGKTSSEPSAFEAGDETVNPFEPAPEKPASLDSGFHFDSGWRPADAVPVNRKK